MLYYSTNHTSPHVNFKEAAIKGLAPDKGLYFPERIPVLPTDFLTNLNAYTKQEIALTVIAPFVGEVIPKSELERIVAETVSFDFPLVKIDSNISTLELFHGPTLAFKDVGARFMSRCLGYFLKNEKQAVTVLVATSGDTGGAVANGFYGVAGVKVVILYPSGKVSPVQELQLTTLGKNISALEVEGSFDDCQDMVKKAFADIDLQKKLFMTSANSINVARWLPQQFYYFFAYQQWKEDRMPVVSVPSGNFGNISAGLLAYKSGLPIKHFIAACNANDVVPSYMDTGEYITRKSVSTLSNAMDVGDPSNFVRIREMFAGQPLLLHDMLSAYSISDAETIATIRKVHQETNYTLDPHGAVGYAALEKYLMNKPKQKGVFLETAHPVKFFDVIEETLKEAVSMPEGVLELSKRPKQSVRMGNDFLLLKDFLLSK